MISDPTRRDERPTTPSPTRGQRPVARVVDRRPALLVATTVLALLLVALLPGAAFGHAMMTGAVPADGSELEAAPEVVTVSFNEPVTADPQSLRVFDADATRVDGGPLDVPADEVAVSLPDLPDGAYVVAYRVVSADGHPIAGTLTFTVGDAVPLDAATASTIGGTDDRGVAIAGATLRGLGYLAVLLAAGAVAFAGLVGRRPGDRQRAADLGWIAAVAGLVATVLHVPVQAAAISGQGVLAVLTDGGALGTAVVSGFGASALVRIVALAALVDVLRRRRRGGPAAGTLGAAPWIAGAAALGSYLLDGHQRTFEPSWLLIGGDVVHLAGAAVWVGGLALLVATFRARRREDDAAGAARLVARFSTVALWSVLALSIAGTAMSLPLVRSVDALTSTTYGWLLLAKVGTVAVVVAIAAYNRRTLVPAVVAHAVPAGASVDVAPPGLATAGSTAGQGGTDAWARLDRTVRVELVLVALVAVLTGFLATTQPAAEAAGLTGPVVETSVLTDDLEVDLVIEPGEVGRNTLHLYVVEPSGQPSDRIEDLRLEFTFVDEGIGPIGVEPAVSGPGHWTATLDDLTFAGGWEVRVVAGEDRFTEHETTIPFTLGG